MERYFAIASKFVVSHAEVIGVQPCGQGLINDTYLVELTPFANATGADIPQSFILQKLNTQVFRQPERVMANVRLFTTHARDRLRQHPLPAGRRWEVPYVLSAADERDYWIDADGSFWRALSYVERTRSLDAVADLDCAREVGLALGTFHALISDLDVARLSDTLEGYHITPSYLQHYDAVLETRAPAPSEMAQYCQQFIRDRRQWASVLEDAKARGELLPRPTHGDPKVNNILFDTTTGQAVSMIDLDTVKPGLVHYDIGDCLRSGCNPLGSSTKNYTDVTFETGLCRAILQGYLTSARSFLSDRDCDYLFDAIRLIAFELGLRFFTDYVEGNVYFKTRYPGQYLARAIVQFKLVESIEAQAATIQSIISDLR
ncbi:MAG: aminoglycoside phosphotransferase family protein [Cyanobacteria bacterium P01_E01_bin.48]